MRILASLIVAIIMAVYIVCTKALMIWACDVAWWLGWVVFVLALTIAVYVTTKV